MAINLRAATYLRLVLTLKTCKNASLVQPFASGVQMPVRRNRHLCPAGKPDIFITKINLYETN